MAKKNTKNESKEMTVREKQELQTEEGIREGFYFKPNVDIFETDKTLSVVADVPGTSADDFEIDIRDNVLTITGYVNPVEQRWTSLYEEYRQGHFMREFRLGQSIDQTKISAEISDGVLRLTLPKAESAQPRKIQVKAG